MKIDSVDYSELKKFWVNVMPFLSPSTRAEQLLEYVNRAEVQSPSGLPEGLLIDVNDVLTQLVRLPREQIKEIDKLLESKGCISISHVRVRYWHKLSRLLKSKKIRSEEDYYLLKAII